MNFFRRYADGSPDLRRVRSHGTEEATMIQTVTPPRMLLLTERER